MARGSLWAIVDRTAYGDCESVRLRGAQPHNAAERRTLLTPFDRLHPCVPPATWRRLQPRAWVHAVRRLARQCRQLGALHTVAGAQIELLPYQLEPALALLLGHATRLLIADEVGLGKTIQAGLIISELAAAHDGSRALVLTPAALRDQWIDELRARFGLAGLKADTAWLAATARSLPPDVNPWSMPGVFVASYDLVKRAEVLRPLEDVTWDVVVVDEAHAASPGTDRHAALHAIASRARHVVLLTATPHAGDAAAFDALRRIGDARATSDTDQPPLVLFRRSRTDVAAGSPRRTVLMPVRPSRPERRMHRLLEHYADEMHAGAAHGSHPRGVLAAVVLRKRALSSAGSLLLSATRRQHLLDAEASGDGFQLVLPLGDEDPLEDHTPDDVLGAPALSDPAEEKRLLAAVIAAARQAAAEETKISFLVRLLRRLREPVIVFTEYRDTLVRLSSIVRSSGRRMLMLHGGMTTDERSEAQRSFNESGDLLLATDAASEGLNLHGRCRLVVHFELPWNPLRLQQRAGRVDRIGQRRRVHEIVLVARDTAESLVLAPLVRRIASARSATAGGAALFDSLTESRIAAAIFGRTSLIDPLESSHAATPPSELDLRREADAEATRALLHRHWRARSGDGFQRERVMAAIGGATEQRASPVAIYRLSLRSVDGRLIHSELIAVDVRLEGQASVRLIAAGLDQRRLVKRVQAILRPTIECRLEIYERTVRVRRLREEAIAALVPSTARELVQAGLFDHRATRSVEQRHQTRRAFLDDAEDRIAVLKASVRPDVSLDPVAILVRGRRR